MFVANNWEDEPRLLYLKLAYNKSQNEAYIYKLARKKKKYRGVDSHL